MSAPASPSPRPRVAASRLFPFLVLATCGFAGKSEAAAAGANLLQNPSAEEGTLVSPAGWDTTGATLPTVRFSWDSETAHAGGRSLYVVNTSDVVPVWYNWNQTINSANRLGNSELTLRGWVKTRNLTGKAYILLQAYRDTVLVEAIKAGVQRIEMRQKMNIKPADDPQIEMGWARKQISGEHPDWTPIETRVYVPPSTNLVFVRAGVLGVGEAWFDDFSLTASPAPREKPFPVGKNLLADPGFEGNLDDWDFSMPPLEALKIRIDPTVSHSGLQSCLIDNQNRPPFQLYSHAYQVFNTRALSGKHVQISGWVKTENLDHSTAFLSIVATGQYGSFRPIVSNGMSGTHDWALMKYDADIPPDTYTVWVRCVMDTQIGKVWFDDMKFEVLGDSKPPRAPAGASRTSKRSGG